MLIVIPKHALDFFFIISNCQSAVTLLVTVFYELLCVFSFLSGHVVDDNFKVPLEHLKKFVI